MPELPDIIQLSTGEAIPLAALEFATSRSGGPGGQNVNKVETRVEVRLRIAECSWLSEETRQTLLTRLANRLEGENTIRVVSSVERSQLGNRIAAVDRLQRLLNTALVPRKERKPTRPTFGAKQRRRQTKQQTSEKKTARRWRPE